jgi:hypothetical protein
MFKKHLFGSGTRTTGVAIMSLCWGWMDCSALKLFKLPWWTLSLSVTLSDKRPLIIWRPAASTTAVARLSKGVQDKSVAFLIILCKSRSACHCTEQQIPRVLDGLKSW